MLRWNKISVEVAPGDAVTSELGSLCLEFIRISQLTGDCHSTLMLFSASLTASVVSRCLPWSQDLLPTTVNARECDFSQGVEFSLGAYIDSAYEYMPKTYQLLGGRAKQYQEMYAPCIESDKGALTLQDP